MIILTLNMMHLCFTITFQAFALIDENADGKLTWDELYKIDLKAMREMFPGYVENHIFYIEVSGSDRFPDHEDLLFHDEL